MLESFIRGAVIAAIVSGAPLLYKLGKKKKAEAIQKGKVYYGVLGCRVFGLFVLGIISSEMVLMAILGDSIEGNIALVLMLFVSFIFTAVYVYVYVKCFKKKLMVYQDNDVLENKKETKNINGKDITHICLSNADEQPKTYGNFNVYGKDITVQKVEQIRQNKSLELGLQSHKIEFNASNIAKTLSDKCAKTVIQINRKCVEIGIDYSERKLVIATFAYFFTQWAYTNKSITIAQVADIKVLYKKQFNDFNEIAFQDDSYKSVMENEQIFDELLEKFLYYAKLHYDINSNSLNKEMMRMYICEFVYNQLDVDTLMSYM